MASKMEAKDAPSKPAKKMHLRGITTTRLNDGSFLHHHHYADSKDSEHTHPPRPMGSSSSLAEALEHVGEQFGPGAGAAPAAGGDDEAAEGEAQAPASPAQ
jgi:hypothetical protein